VRAAALRATTRRFGLSVGDRACLALALREQVPAVTTDRAWSKLSVGVEVVLIR
jgi:PIN domain nuclease of toxin-antitoxin system